MAAQPGDVAMARPGTNRGPEERSATLLGALSETRYWTICLLLPSLVLLAAVMLYPCVHGGLLSFREMRPTRPDLGTGFVGLAHYRAMLADPIFWLCLRNTAVFVTAALAIEFALGLGAALALHRGLPGSRLFGLAIMLPFFSADGRGWPYVGAVARCRHRHRQCAAHARRPGHGSPALARGSGDGAWSRHPGRMLARLSFFRLDSPRRTAAGAARRDASRDHGWRRPAGTADAHLAADHENGDRGGDHPAGDRPRELARPDADSDRRRPGRATEVLSLYAFRKAYAEFDFGYSAALSMIMLALLMLLAASYLRATRAAEGPSR